jgi:hypothetical protein
MTSHQPETVQTPTCVQPRSGHWLEVLLHYRYAMMMALIFMFAFGHKAMAQEFKSAADCVVGKRVMTREKQAGVVIKADGSSCHVKLDSTGKIDYNIFWMLRAETAAGKSGDAGKSGKANLSADRTSLGGDLPLGKYACYMLIGSNMNYAFIDIHIEGGNRYRDKNGKTGTYQVDAAQKIRFTGPLSSANAKLLAGPRIGLNMNGGNFFNTTCSINR